MLAGRTRLVPYLLCCAALGLTTAVRADERFSPLPRAFYKPVPENISDLKDIQVHVHNLISKVLPLTVSLKIGPSQGSGVIISKEGYILTAAHVSGKADQPVDIVLHDGRKMKGKTLGANQAVDSGLVKIAEPGFWMHADMAPAADIYKGQWCLALGHPLGYHEGRPPVVRLGRVLEAEKLYLRTDCPLVGGDSGGPLFDMHGRVIGVHSRIGNLLSANIHVPADVYREAWDRLARGEVWGMNLFDHGADAYLGVRIDPAGRVTVVAPHSPADKAGIRINDVMTWFDGRKIGGNSDLEAALRDKVPGAEVAMQLRRGEAIINLHVILAKKST